MIKPLMYGFNILCPLSVQRLMVSTYVLWRLWLNFELPAVLIYLTQFAFSSLFLALRKYLLLCSILKLFNVMTIKIIAIIVTFCHNSPIYIHFERIPFFIFNGFPMYKFFSLSVKTLSICP